MRHDPFIADTMWPRIGDELAAIERVHRVRVLLAVESGSRAWRFPSADSDYDLRFLYAHPIDAYLSVDLPDEVIAGPPDSVLDINGWDLRKALRLLLRSNAVLVEWLRSPVRYRDDGASAQRILALARETCHLPAFAYHYDCIARKRVGEIGSSCGLVRFKTYCYALRAALALAWVVRQRELPPMDLPTLLTGMAATQDLRRATAALVECKAAAHENGTMPRQPALDAFLAEVLSVPIPRPVLPDRDTARVRADALFASIIGDAARAGGATPR